MKSILSLNRMLLLFRSMLIQNKTKDIWLFLVVIGIAIVFGLLTGSVFATYHVLNLPIVLILFVLASNAFNKLSRTTQAIPYLMLPASTTEKAIVTIVYIQFYYLVMLCLSAFLGFYGGELLRYLLAQFPLFNSLFYDTDLNIPCHFSYNSVSFDCFTFLSLQFWLSVMLFGSVYFKKHALIKTPLSLFCYFLFNIVVLVILFVATDTFTRNNYGVLEISAVTKQVVLYMGVVLGTLFFWFMTYLRLRETEV